MSPQRIYFDNAASTPIDPRVAAAMSRAVKEYPANPSSLHREGREAHAAIEQARTHVADLLGAMPGEILFTSGGTESNNLAIRGVLGGFSNEPLHVVTTAIEHPSVLDVVRRLNPGIVRVSLVPTDASGIIDPASLRAVVSPRTALISIMAANNVAGTLQPIAECGRIAREVGAIFHVDAVQAAGKIPLDVNALNIDLLSLSAHKIYGPKGIGALFVREGTPLLPLIHGGGQEGGMRSGTENVPGIVGFGEAARMCLSRTDEVSALVQMRDRLIDRVLEEIPGAYLIGDRYRRLPGLACFGFEGLEGHAMRLLLALDDAGIAVSTGSACSAHHLGEPSHVLAAMGFDPVRARGSLRVSLGRGNTLAEVDQFVDILASLTAQLAPLTLRRA